MRMNCHKLKGKISIQNFFDNSVINRRVKFSGDNCSMIQIKINIKKHEQQLM